MFAKEALAGDGEVAKSRFRVQANRLGHEMRQMRNSNVERALPPYLSLIGKSGSFRYQADWSDARHHYRRFASEFIGTFGFVFTLAAGAAIFHAYAHPAMSAGMTLALMTSVCALWLVVAIHALADVSAHFNPAISLGFAMRGDMSWARALAYVIVQCIAGISAALLARAFFGTASGLSICHPQPGKPWQDVAFELLLTAMFGLLVLAMADGPKLNGPNTPLAVAAYVLSFGMLAGLYDGTAFNFARVLGPDVVLGDFRDLWVYATSTVVGPAIAVGIDRYMRGAATTREAAIAEAETTQLDVSDAPTRIGRG